MLHYVNTFFIIPFTKCNNRHILDIRGDYMSGTIGEKIKELRELNELSQAQLAIKIGVSRSLISHWESNNRKPSYVDLEKISNIFDVSADYLIGTTTVPNGEVIRKNKKALNEVRLVDVPLYFSVSCGNGCFAEDNIEDYIKITDKMLNPHKKYFCQYAKGDSMTGENIHEGDLLVFEITQHIENGEIGCFCLEHNSAVCKKFYHDKDKNVVTLQSANSEYAPITISYGEIDFRVVGKLALVINSRSSNY